MLVSPRISYVEALSPRVLMFGGGAFGRSLGLHEVTGRGTRDGISVLIRRRGLAMWGHGRQWPSAGQEVGPHQNQSMLAPCSQTFTLRNREKQISVA